MNWKNITIVIMGIVVGLIELVIYAIIIVPYFKPVTITGKYTPYIFTLEKNYAIIHDYLGDEEEVTIPSYLWFHKVTRMDSKNLSLFNDVQPFCENQTVKKVIIPDTVTEITHSFCKCTNLEEVILSNDLHTIDSSFKLCSSLESVILPDGLERVVDSYWYCEKLARVEISDSVYSLICSFCDCSELKEAIIPDTVEEIDSGSFSNTFWKDSIQDEFVIAGKNCLIGYNGNDKEVYVPNGVEFIDGFVFDIEATERFYVPRTVKTMDMSAFYYAENLKYIILDSDEISLRDTQEEQPVYMIIANPGSTGELYAIEKNIPYMSDIEK